jgi:hypothetical protein
MKLARTFLPYLLVPLALAACGGDDPAAPEQPAAPDPVVDAALVGEWLGRVQGSGGGISGAADIRFELDADGRMRASVSNLPFHPIPSGTWGVAEGAFVAKGVDTGGSVVHFEAPYSTTHLQGNWKTGRAAGTFSVMMQ